MKWNYFRGGLFFLPSEWFYTATFDNQIPLVALLFYKHIHVRWEEPPLSWLLQNTHSMKTQGYFCTVFRISDFNTMWSEIPSCQDPAFPSRRYCFSTHTKRQHFLPLSTAVHLSILVLDVRGLHHLPPTLPAIACWMWRRT